MAIHLLGLSTGTILLPRSPSYFRRRQLAPLPRKINNADTDTDNDSDSDDVNHKVFPKTKGNAKPQRQNDKTAIELCSYAVVWWVLMGLTRVLGIGEGVSRRMVSWLLCITVATEDDIHLLFLFIQVNISYILWVAAFNTTFMFGYLFLDLFFFPSPLSKSVPSPSSKLKVPIESNTIPRDQRLTPVVGNPPALLEAVNRNGLILFLLVGRLPYSRPLYMTTLSLTHYTNSGQYYHRAHKSLDTHDVYVWLVGNVYFGWICMWHMCGCMEFQRSADLATLSGSPGWQNLKTGNSCSQEYVHKYFPLIHIL
jgi:hypothetical protein